MCKTITIVNETQAVVERKAEENVRLVPMTSAIQWSALPNEL